MKKSSSFIYHGMDIEYNKNCDIIYDKFYNQNVEDLFIEKYNLITSLTLLEHVRNNKKTITNIYKALITEGITVHYIPSKNHPYALILRLFGDKLQKKIIRLFRPWAQAVTGYKAYFNHCSPWELKKLFKKVGLKKISVICYYRANNYFKFFFPLYVFITLFENLSRMLRLKLFCSGFIITAKKNKVFLSTNI